MIKLPCLRENGLKIFTITAGQRLQLGSEHFLNTHYPIRFNKVNHNAPHIDLSEDSILDRLINLNGISPGNRVILLYGAAGSGKSEFMAWLDLQLNQQTKRPIFRISRTELDIFHIIENIKYWLTGEFFEAVTHQRWQEIRRKPRTFTKLITLKCLENLIDSDDVINALYYRLVDRIEPHITQLLSLEQDIQNLELIPRDLFDEICAATVLPIQVDYEVFRHHLQDEFRRQLFEGLNIQTALQAISESFAKQGQRPILLIDDLVQSVNVFATEFLDFFITLDKGNWDVVIGLTPASFETDKRHRDILQRITLLDTIDDRVEKLWLSDEQGNVSYVLTEDNCVEFAFKYLQKFRQLNQVECSTCPLYHNCKTLSQPNPNILAPFNKDSLIRIFRALPNNKGKIRYFLKYLREVLDAFIHDQSIADAFKNLKSDITVEAKNHNLKELATWYTPVDCKPGQHQLEASVSVFFGLDEDSSFDVQYLTMQSRINIANTQLGERKADVSHEAIEQWLAGENTNKQLLSKLRKGIALWLKLVYPVEYFHREGIANPYGCLRYKQVEMSTNPPIQFESIDSFDGIPVSRSIGHAAYYFDAYASASRQQRIELKNTLNNDPRTFEIIWSGIVFNESKRIQLETVLNIPLNMFALGALITTMFVKQNDDDLHTVFPQHIVDDIRSNREQIINRMYKQNLFSNTIIQITRQLFDDFFCLRKNIIDGHGIREIFANHDIVFFLNIIRSIDVKSIPTEYYAKSLKLGVYIQKLQHIIALIDEISQQNTWDFSEHMSDKTRTLLHNLQNGQLIALSEVDSEMLRSIELETPQLYNQMSLLLRLDNITDHNSEA